jgi:hypothetical protein
MSSDNWIVESKYHEHAKPNDWKYYNYKIKCKTPLKELLKEDIKKDGVPLFLSGGECFKKGTVKKNYKGKCGRHIKKHGSSEIEVITMTDKKIVITEKHKPSSSITEETYYNVPASTCKEAQKIMKEIEDISLWEMNELSNWFSWGKPAKFPRVKDHLPKNIKDKIVKCNKLLPKDRIHFPHDHICHKTLLDAGELSEIYRIKRYGDIVDLVTDHHKLKFIDKKGRINELESSIKTIKKRMAERSKKKKWLIGKPDYIAAHKKWTKEMKKLGMTDKELEGYRP